MSEAVASGDPVEVAELTTETRRVMADPSGEFVAEVAAAPVRVRDGQDWVPVDTSLVPDDGEFVPAASPVDVSVSSGGVGEFARVESDGFALGLSWPEALPAPVVRGDVAVFSDVRPGIDLVVRADTEGFGQFLVVHDQAAAADPLLDAVSLGVDTTGLTLRAAEPSGIEAVDSDGVAVFAGSALRMWEAGQAADAGE
ncbi:MAG: hypothetical protein ACTH2Q_21405, partial [Propionibacteriaceae bacterium]